MFKCLRDFGLHGFQGFRPRPLDFGVQLHDLDVCLEGLGFGVSGGSGIQGCLGFRRGFPRIVPLCSCGGLDSHP